MAYAAASAEPRVLLDLNTTPLIDVLLVLLVMFIITIPLQSHAVKLDLPPPCASCPDINPVRNTLVITSGGAILWNGAPVDRRALAANLYRSRRMTPAPELHLKPESAARYEIVDEVLAMTGRAGLSRVGFVGNERYRDF